MPAERFDFANAQGEKLAALLDRPDGPIRSLCSRIALPAAKTIRRRA
jgi:hypothetical protein